MSAGDYFGAGATRRHPDHHGRYARVGDQVPVDAGGGVTLRAVTGLGVMLSYVTVEAHGEAPVHTHDEEQMGIVLTGTCTFELEGETRVLEVGDVYHAPPGVPHGVRAGDEPCTLVDVFAPPRQALLDLLAVATGDVETPRP